MAGGSIRVGNCQGWGKRASARRSPSLSIAQSETGTLPGSRNPPFMTEHSVRTCLLPRLWPSQQLMLKPSVAYSLALFVCAPALADNCKFSVVCEDQGACTDTEFAISYDYTDDRDERGNRTASMAVSTMPWLKHEGWQKPWTLRGYLAEVEPGERTYHFSGPNADILLSTVRGSAAMTVHVTNARLNPPVIRLTTYFGACSR